MAWPHDTELAPVERQDRLGVDQFGDATPIIAARSSMSQPMRPRIKRTFRRCAETSADEERDLDDHKTQPDNGGSGTGRRRTTASRTTMWKPAARSITCGMVR